LPKALPATIEFENYDVGGPDVSFKDNSVGNEGEHYRKDGVDIKASAKAGNGAVVGFTQNGEWMEYTVSVAKAGVYPLAVTYATPETGRRILLSLNGKPVGEAIAFPATTSWDDLKTIEAGTVSLPAAMPFCVTIENGPVDLDRLEIKPQIRTCPTAPTGGALEARRQWLMGAIAVPCHNAELVEHPRNQAPRRSTCAVTEDNASLFISVTSWLSPVPKSWGGLSST
jgi:hypothetical protein